MLRWQAYWTVIPTATNVNRPYFAKVQHRNTSSLLLSHTTSSIQVVLLNENCRYEGKYHGRCLMSKLNGVPGKFIKGIRVMFHNN